MSLSGTVCIDQDLCYIILATLHPSDLLQEIFL